MIHSNNLSSPRHASIKKQPTVESIKKKLQSMNKTTSSSNKIIHPSSINSLGQINAITGRTRTNNHQYIDNNSYSFSKDKNSKYDNKIKKPKQINVSQFMVQQQILNNQDDKKQEDNGQLLQNISRIIACKKQADAVLSKVQVYIQTINKLKKQHTYLQQHLHKKQQQCRQLHNQVHYRDLQIISLKQQNDRLTRNNIMNVAKINVLKEIQCKVSREKWEEILKNQLGNQYQDHASEELSLNYDDNIYQNDADSLYSKMQPNSLSQSKQTYIKALQNSQAINRSRKQNTNMQNLTMNYRNKDNCNIQIPNPEGYSNGKRQINKNIENQGISNQNINISTFLRQNIIKNCGKIVKSSVLNSLQQKRWNQQSTFY